MTPFASGAPRFLAAILLTACALLPASDTAHANAVSAPDTPIPATDAAPLASAAALGDSSPPAEAAASPQEQLIRRVQATWPEDSETATRVLICESHAGDDPDTYNLDAPNGGPMQLNRDTWEPYFKEKYGWSWVQVVNDIDIHLAAARIIYDRAGGWMAWRCL